MIDIEKLRANRFEDSWSYCRENEKSYEKKCAELQNRLEECLSYEFTSEELKFMREEGIL